VREEDITVALVERLLASQFSQWAALPVTAVVESGVDNRTFRLGEHMLVRLPAAERYAHQVEKEHRWLPTLSGHLPLPIPEPLAKGEPEHGYPWHWSIYRWLPGATARPGPTADLHSVAADLGVFLAALHRVEPASGPPASDRTWFRARADERDEQTRAAISALEGVVDTGAAYEVWDAARRAPEADSPTWIHGDVSANNLLVRNGRLSAVIDFGCSGIGDPAFDLEVAWELFSGETRAIFQDHLALDDAAWARGRGWKLWAASRALVDGLRTGAEWVDWPRRVIGELLSDHRRRFP
jgi:aminoglycoside phosphotransferase (APT) family kinase protein